MCTMARLYVLCSVISCYNKHVPDQKRMTSLLYSLPCSEAFEHLDLTNHKCEETAYSVLYCYVLYSVLLYGYTIPMG